MSNQNPGKSTPIAISTLAALGIVYGDIGTSPLYAFRECFAHEGDAVALSPENLCGAASLILWSLMLVISVKYLCVILRLNYKGEGGILALSSLIVTSLSKSHAKLLRSVFIAGLAGASLIYADGVLTPAISVLSAVEGLAISAPALGSWIVPIAVGILFSLFAIQRSGTEIVGRLFGPVVVLWFVSLAILGIMGVAKAPGVLMAINPIEGIHFLLSEWKHALPILAAVFLAVTGGEALYADLGHFGTRPIRAGWFIIVLPCLALNYLGQAALLTIDPGAIRSPFFLLAPEFLRFPLTILATCAAVVASQALISGVFSLSAQAVQLSILPRLRIRHTSRHAIGQVYLPFVNWALAASCIILVLTFRTSANLAGAYGVAISLTMLITTALLYFAATYVWSWQRWKALLLVSPFLMLDVLFLVANGTKIFEGGWIPLVIAFAICLLMANWIWGRGRLSAQITKSALPVDLLVADLQKGRIHRVKGTAIFMSGHARRVPTALLHNLKHNQVAHERIFLLHVQTLDQPHADPEQTLNCEDIGQGLYRITLRFGFADIPDVPLELETKLPAHLAIRRGSTTYFVGKETYRVGKNARNFDRIRLSIFASMVRNSATATAHFKLPPSRIVEIGGQITL